MQFHSAATEVNLTRAKTKHMETKSSQQLTHNRLLQKVKLLSSKAAAIQADAASKAASLEGAEEQLQNLQVEGNWQEAESAEARIADMRRELHKLEAEARNASASLLSTRLEATQVAKEIEKLDKTAAAASDEFALSQHAKDSARAINELQVGTARSIQQGFSLRNSIKCFRHTLILALLHMQ